ncbi:MAG: glycosyltransferase family 4 protein [Bacillota bacterium]
MKIALICTEKLPVPPVAGGAIQLYIDGVVPYLAKRHDITVYSIKHPGLPDEETRDNVRYVRMPGKSGPVYLENLKTRLDSSHDLVHVFNRPLFLHGLSESFPDVKFSLSLHNEMFHHEKISNEAALKCIEKAEFINTVSRYIANTVIQRFPSAEGKMRVVYSGVDPYKYHPGWTDEGAKIKHEMKIKHGIENYKVVLNVGRLSVKKGVHILIKAMEKVMSGHPDTALVIVGSKWYGSSEADEYTNYVKSLSQKLPGPVVFTGFVPPSEIPGYYCMGDIFVCASQWNEPLARVHYEAMAAGLPIITTNRGGNAEVVNGFGNGVAIDEYNNPNVMAGEIIRLLDNPDVAVEMGMKGRKLAEEEFSWEKVASRILGVPE